MWPRKVKRWTKPENGPERQKCNKPACGLKQQDNLGRGVGGKGNGLKQAYFAWEKG